MLNAARDTVGNVVGTVQTVAGAAIDAAGNTVIGNIDAAQQAAQLAIQTGQGVIGIGGNYVLGVLNGVNGAVGAIG